MESIKEIIIFFAGYPFTISFVGAFFGGEETIMSIAFLAAQGLMSVWTVFFGALFGTLVSDSFWFLLARTSLADKLLKKKYFKGAYDKTVKIFEKATKRSVFLSILAGKFIYGTRIVTIAYLAREKISFKKFLVYNFFILLCWLLVIIYLGYLAGQGFFKAMNIFQDFEKAIFYLLIFLVVVYLIRLLISKFVTKEIKEL